MGKSMEKCQDGQSMWDYFFSAVATRYSLKVPNEISTGDLLQKERKGIWTAKSCQCTWIAQDLFPCQCSLDGIWPCWFSWLRPIRNQHEDDHNKMIEDNWLIKDLKDQYRNYIYIYTDICLFIYVIIYLLLVFSRFVVQSMCWFVNSGALRQRWHLRPGQKDPRRQNEVGSPANLFFKRSGVRSSESKVLQDAQLPDALWLQNKLLVRESAGTCLLSVYFKTYMWSM